MNNSLRTFICLLLVSMASYNTQAQSLQDLWGKLFNQKNQQNNDGSLNNLKNTEIVSALKQALEIGTQNASGALSATNGFFGNALVKIMLPEEAKHIETALRKFGMDKLVDETILTMNRAAEDAAGKAVPIFVNAISSMSIQDGMQILTGGEGAATQFLKNKTTQQLTVAFEPVIRQALGKFNVTSHWNQLFTTYNSLPLVEKKVNPDLIGYVTEKTLDGLFLTIAQEENKIRENPGARTTELLKKVFGAK